MVIEIAPPGFLDNPQAFFSKSVPYTDREDWPAFVAGIFNEPDDDLPRLVAADWLEGEGYVDRAEFIRISCEASDLRKDADRRGVDLGDRKTPEGKRAEELRRLQLGALGSNAYGAGGARERYAVEFSPNAREWFGVPFAGFYSHDLERGFVFEVTATVDQWRDHGPELVKRHFLRRVKIQYPAGHSGPWNSSRPSIPEDWLPFMPKGVPHGRRDEDILRSACAIAWARAPRPKCDNCGGTTVIDIEGEPCDVCHGTGFHVGYRLTCEECAGAGGFGEPFDGEGDMVECLGCHGAGFIVTDSKPDDGLEWGK